MQSRSMKSMKNAEISPETGSFIIIIRKI